LPPRNFVHSDYFAAIRQLAGLPVSARRGRTLPAYPRLDQRQFDLVLLDPPAWARSAFGTVDLLRDYQSLLKPALLATAEDGVLICCNNLAKVSMEDWRAQVLRCAEKAGRPVREWQVLTPAADFPSLDGLAPLKTLILRL
jgi:23S rRNA (cytosine1962-C5)-methyltransferase